MSVKRRRLPPGWYPATAEAVRRQIGEFLGASGVAEATARAPAGIVPHAGWVFSGAIAAGVFAKLDRGAETVVVVGGHLGRADRTLVAREEGLETPQGILATDTELTQALEARWHLEADGESDNTVEVQLPMVGHFWPLARVLALRAPPRVESFELGRTLAVTARELGRRVAVVGSTDLTHYGPNYGYTPRGTGRRALEWVRNENDARILRAMVALDAAGVVAAAEEGRAACSAGGALTAMGFAAECGVKAGILLRYATSYDVHPDDSFVGYAGIVFPAGS